MLFGVNSVYMYFGRSFWEPPAILKVNRKHSFGDHAEIKTLRTWHGILPFGVAVNKCPKSLYFSLAMKITGEESRQRFLHNNNCLKISTDAVQLKPVFDASEVIEWKKTPPYPYVFVQQKKRGDFVSHLLHLIPQKKCKNCERTQCHALPTRENMAGTSHTNSQTMDLVSRNL